MDKKPRKQRSDSAAASIRAAQNAVAPPLMPPACKQLTESELVFFHDIVLARARDDWRDADLYFAADLARCLCDLDREQVAMRGEDSVLEASNGNKVENPRIKIISRYRSEAASIARTLQIGGRVAGDPRTIEKARALEQKARETAGQIAAEENALLAD